ncbi:GTP-binding protein [Streptomyces sp. NBC_01275]|uniref:sulfate adenylyltransferase subunit 1 n=1 Tax=Streptomyces sp. NBC_01275 TaxID=2903807 RepID=UPI00225BDF2F|nr:GTP-binding protein [Streptomyces sp. NBC_01275]MCX4765578.1 GTP-binding protein [Streptomyces sp. NBC_01275]
MSTMTGTTVDATVGLRLATADTSRFATADTPRLATADTLRFATAGSVDDGKSTLVGRLLHDSKSVLADQLEAVETASRNRGKDTPDLALLTDGLRAEREQGITIDVAYRYFATPKRRFILADTPGHVQYTRNMVTGASTAELAIILVDSRSGIVEQTRRHAAVAALLRVPQVVLAVNKMDLVGYAQGVFERLVEEFAGYAAELGLPGFTPIPVSALAGDNVVERSTRMDWYAGPALLEFLENVPVAADPADAPARFPVQYVIRHGDVRHYAGQLVSGSLRVGDRVTVHPSGETSEITAIDALGTAVETAYAPQSVGVRLADQRDVSRGDMITAGGEAPVLTQDVRAAVCHLADRPLRVGDRVLLKHTTRTVKAIVKDLAGAQALSVNDLGRITLRTAEPLALDDYGVSRRTGAFLLIDPADGATLTAGMVDLAGLG